MAMNGQSHFRKFEKITITAMCLYCKTSLSRPSSLLNLSLAFHSFILHIVSYFNKPFNMPSW